LGFFEAKINGQKVSEDRYVPVVSNYEPRATETFLCPIHDTMTHRVYYCKYDVTPFIRAGENQMSIQLGNGWYRQKERVGEGKVYFGEELKAIYTLLLETATGMRTIRSDGSETWYESEITYNNLFIGEVIDPAAVEIAPRIPKKLEYAKGSIHTPKGEIKVAWEKKEDKVAFSITVPDGIKAIF